MGKVKLLFLRPRSGGREPRMPSLHPCAAPPGPAEGEAWSGSLLPLGGLGPPTSIA